MKAVFGLGNPGLAYALTRHNVGFEVVDLYRKVHRLRARGRIEHSALVYSWDDLLLVKPMTCMNDSGRAVGAFDFPVGFFKNDQEILAFAPLQFGLGEKFRFGFAHRAGRPARGNRRGLGRRQIEAESSAARENDGAFEHIAQLADVAGPVVALKLNHAGAGQARLGAAHFLER